MANRDYCIHIETISEREVKRVKYILEKEEIDAPAGLFFFSNGNENDMKKLINTLMAKTSSERVHVYQVNKEDFKLDELTQELEVETEGNEESVEKLVQFLIAKRKGILQRSDIGKNKLYHIYTKKGSVNVSTKIKKVDKDRSNLKIIISGYREAVSIIYQEFKREVEFFN